MRTIHGAYYLCFLVQILACAYYALVHTIPREIRYCLYSNIQLNLLWAATLLSRQPPMGGHLDITQDDI